MTPRALMSLLFNGSKAIDVVQTAFDLGILEALEPGPITLADLSDRFGLLPVRLHKLLDCLECLGFVVRVQPTGSRPPRPEPVEGRDSSEPADVEYRAVVGVRQAAADVLGAGSIERDRDGYPWTALHGRLPEILRGDFGLPEQSFQWPPAEAQVAAFEQSMAAGLGPFVESFQLHAERLWDGRKRIRLLDIGGGDGTLAARLLPGTSGLLIDVYNLPAVRPLVVQTRSALDHGHRLGFVGGDFLAQPLPAGYDALSFVRVLHDWPSATAQTLLRKAFEALTPGGRVIICEEFRNAERLAQQFFWSYFLIGVDSCSSMLREVAEYITILTTEGFTDIEVLPGPVEIIIATKPSSGTQGIDPADRYPARLFRGLG